MHYRRFFNFTCFPILMTFIFTLGAEAQESAESDFFDEAPLILTVSRMSKPLDESPASVSIITRKMIEASGAREIADLFRLVPGFIVGNFNGGKPVVTYHGFGNEFPRKMQVLVDGRSVFIPSFGGVPWSNLPLLLEDIERIEIIRGPNAVTYGENAFLATINIITRHAAEDYGARYSITTSDNANPDIEDAYLRLGFHHEDLDWRLSVGTLNDDGFSNVNDSSDIQKLNFRLDYLSSNNQSWTFQAGTSDSIYGRGYPGNFDNIERDVDATNSYLNIHWERNTTSMVSSIRLTHTEQEVTDAFFADSGVGSIPRITADIDFGRISKRTDFEMIRSQEFGDNYRLVYGASLRRDKVKSLYLFNDLDFHDVDTTRLFTSLEWRLNQYWLFDLGTTLEDSRLTERESSPRLSIIRKLNLDHTFRFVASKAKRNPILYESEGNTTFIADIDLDSDGIFDLIDVNIQFVQGNTDIEPEDIISYELGLRSQLKDTRLSSDVKLFTYKISDHIVGIPTGNSNPLGGSIETTTNQEITRVTGLELALDYSPSPSIDIKSGFSFVDSDSTDQNFDNSIPDKTAFINADYRWNSRHNFSASFYYIDEMQWLDASKVNVIQPIKKLDLRYAYIFDQQSETRFELIGQNLLEDYNDYKLENLVEPVILLRISGGF